MLKSSGKFIDHKENLSRGDILRCKGKYPYESFVDFMIIESVDENYGTFSIMVASGYKAGLRYAVLPKESIPDISSNGSVNTQWLIDNWKKWGYCDCDINDVYYVKNVPPISF